MDTKQQVKRLVRIHSDEIIARIRPRRSILDEVIEDLSARINREILTKVLEMGNNPSTLK